ncbi:hypothetical protein ACFVT1_14165 [Streptomyces sp. NPDC057963]|uniref:hypothetical protein n=1 Tax=Streptomyces sp. NPDC057963 TaxID=3346290 RepID=UPI0036E25C4D
MVRLAEQLKASERLLRAVDDLDETSKIIRSTVFGLHVRDSGRVGQGLRSWTATVVEQAARTLGFQPSLRMGGPEGRPARIVLQYRTTGAKRPSRRRSPKRPVPRWTTSPRVRRRRSARPCTG